MNPSPEEALFALALAKPVEKRAAFLDVMCDGDAALRQRLEALLAAHDQPDNLVPAQAETVRPTIKLDLADAPDEAVGQTLGRYKLLERVGEGGCGVVYVAEQTQPVRRRVALKVIKLGMDTREVIARFEAERQALAMMDHPNIAKVLDAGTTDAGRPYFVMELVRGIRITDYCDQANLTTKERLDLFIKVCQAIQHAHQKGIIHRDIKPGNILVTLHDGVPVPKVIDFGIAKATEGRLTDNTVYTQLHQFIGTPAYMSPEQAEMSGLDIDTRSDIYSLGVLLYELLAGSTPFDGRELLASGIDAMRKTIREKEPQRPSTRLATLGADQLTTTAKRRSADTSKLLHQLKGDLDWIVMKCLEKDRQRRYDTATGLAADLKRHLNNEPVIARAPSAGYKFGKFARRNKVGFAVAATIAAVLVLATGVSVWQARLARKAGAAALAAKQDADAKAKAERVAREESEAITKFLTGVFQSPDPARDGRTITVAETLDKAVKNLDHDLAIQPARQASLQGTLGRTYHALGLYREAIPLRERDLNFRRNTQGLEHPNTLTAMESLADSYHAAGRRDEALKLREEVLTPRRKVNGPGHLDTLGAMHDLADSYFAAGRGDEARKLQEEVLRRWEEILALRRKVLGPEHPDTLTAMHHLAAADAGTGRRDEAHKLREELPPLYRKVLGPEHPDTLKAMYNLAVSCTIVGRWNEARKLREELLPLYRKVLGPDHPDTLTAMYGLAELDIFSANRREAYKRWEELLPLRRKMLGPEHPDTLLAMEQLARFYQVAGRQDETLKLHEELLPLRRKVLGLEHRDTLSSMTVLANFYNNAGRRDEALKLREEVLPLYRKVLGPEHLETLWAMGRLATSYFAAGRRDEAGKLWEERLANARKPGTNSPAVLESAIADVAELRYRQKQYAAAELLYREQMEILLREPLSSRLRRPLSPGSDPMIEATANLGRLLSEWAWGERATNASAAVQHAREGESLAREALVAFSLQTNTPAWRKADQQSQLGGALSVLAFTDRAVTPATRETKLIEAETLLQQSHAALEQYRKLESTHHRDALERFIRLYEAWEKPVKLAEWKQKLKIFEKALAAMNPAQP